MTNPSPAPALTDLQRLADLPEMIAKQGRTLNGLKSDLERAERKQTAIEARLRLSDAVRAEKNTDDRKAALVLACEADAEWCKTTERITELRGMIRATGEQKDLLRREKDILQGKTIANAAARLHAIMEDQKFAELVAKAALA